MLEPTIEEIASNIARWLYFTVVRDVIDEFVAETVARRVLEGILDAVCGQEEASRAPVAKKNVTFMEDTEVRLFDIKRSAKKSALRDYKSQLADEPQVKKEVKLCEKKKPKTWKERLGAAFRSVFCCLRRRH